MEHTSYSTDTGAFPAEVPRALSGGGGGHSALEGHWLCPSLSERQMSEGGPSALCCGSQSASSKILRLKF